MGEKHMPVAKFRTLSNRLKAILLGTAIALIGVLAIAPAVSLASAPQQTVTAPQLLQPRDGKLLHTSTPIFSWTEVLGASFYVDIAADADMTNIVQRPFSFETFVRSEPLLPGDYYWRVTAVDNNSHEEAHSEVRSFTVH